jgi:hypothetical protein
MNISIKGITLMTIILFMAASIPASAGAEQPEKFPFFPSLINTSTGEPVQPDEFEDPEVCAGCHDEIFEQWDGSMHSKAMVDPVFQALWKLAVKETEGEVDTLCLGCHTAIGVVTDGVTVDPETMEVKASDIALQGVQCDFCHTIEGTSIQYTPTMDPNNASLIMDPGEVKRGPYDDSESPYHDTEFSELHTSSEFCGSCHNVFHPVSNFPIERTYDEWSQSVYARAGIQCQDCHMMPVAVASETARTLKKGRNPGKASSIGPDREQVRTHEFVGGNFAIPALLGSELHAKMAKERMKSAAEMELLFPEGSKAGDLVRFKVKVTNVGAGHNLPTSLTEVRQMWLDVTVLDGKGNEIFRSGALDKEGNIDPEAAIFRSWAVDKDGHHTDKPWEISHFESVRTIEPKGSDLENYAFLVPKDASGDMTIKAVLRYRSFPQYLANLLLGDGAPTVPVVDMTTVEGKLSLK